MCSRPAHVRSLASVRSMTAQVVTELKAEKNGKAPPFAPRNQMMERPMKAMPVAQASVPVAQAMHPGAAQPVVMGQPVTQKC